MDKLAKEPATMVEAKALAEAAYPGKPVNVYVNARHGIRYVRVKFGRHTIEGMGNTWTAAIRDVETIRKELRKRKETA